MREPPRLVEKYIEILIASKLLSTFGRKEICTSNGVSRELVDLEVCRETPLALASSLCD
jgi:hypothetical protein